MLKRSLDKKQIRQDVLFVVVIVAIVSFVVYYPQRNLIKNHKYTVATIVDIKGTLNGAPDAIISYTVDRQSYSGSISSYKGGNVWYKKGDRVFLEFYPLDPNQATFIEGKNVSDKLTKIPDSGWDALPY